MEIRTEAILERQAAQAAAVPKGEYNPHKPASFTVFRHPESSPTNTKGYVDQDGTRFEIMTKRKVGSIPAEKKSVTVNIDLKELELRKKSLEKQIAEAKKAEGAKTPAHAEPVTAEPVAEEPAPEPVVGREADDKKLIAEAHLSREAGNLSKWPHFQRLTRGLYTQPERKAEWARYKADPANFRFS